MAQITEIKISYTRRVTLPRYEHAVATVTLGALLDEGEDVQEAIDGLFALATQGVRAKLLPLVSHTHSRVEEGVEVQVNGRPYTGGPAVEADT